MRMHIGFSFKPKAIIVGLAILAGIVLSLVSAYADEGDTVPVATSSDAPVVVINTTSDNPTVTPSYTFNRASHTGLAGAIENVFGLYQPLYQTDQLGNVSAVSGIAGVDFAWVGGAVAFFILFYSFFRLLGGVFIGKSR